MRLSACVIEAELVIRFVLPMCVDSVEFIWQIVAHSDYVADYPCILTERN